jgi:hypothetical protein
MHTIIGWAVAIAVWMAGVSIFVAGWLLATGIVVWAQHNHARGHNDYLGWSSGKINNCCNNDDCGTLKDDEVRETATGTQVLIAGEWCPVLREHYITRGKSPDWNATHACVGKTPYYTAMPPCERLLCFSGKGGV